MYVVKVHPTERDVTIEYTRSEDNTLERKRFYLLFERLVGKHCIRDKITPTLLYTWYLVLDTRYSILPFPLPPR